MRRWDWLVLLLSSILLLGLYEAFAPPRSPEQGVRVVIPPGWSTPQIAQHLNRLGLVRSPEWFAILARVMAMDRRLKSGIYIMPENPTELEVLKILNLGPGGVWVTIPEGLRIEEIAQILSDSGVVDREEFLRICRAPELAEEFDIPIPNLEGYLFPDTYLFSPSSPAAAVVRVMVENLHKVYRRLVQSYTPEFTLHQLLTLASMVELETRLPSERPIVASVFLNRLRKGMPLQCDPTIQYLLPKRKPRLTYQDLKTPSPYNTYLNPGLPPGPICSPGEEAIKAVLAPAQTPYLYFVAQGDGSHRFSSTVEEHERNRREIRRGRREGR